MSEVDIAIAHSQLELIEASLKRAITQIGNSSIDTETKTSFVADLEEILGEVHHLVPHHSQKKDGA